MVDGVADELGHDLGKGVELLAAGGGAGDLLLGDAAGTHDAPLVVVAAQPGVGDVVHADIIKDLLGIQMAVVVEDGHFLGVLVVEPAGRLSVEEKILRNKALHSACPPSAFCVRSFRVSVALLYHPFCFLAWYILLENW